MISHERLTELLSYDPTTGLFTWKVTSPRHFLSNPGRGNLGPKAGDPAGANGCNIQLDGKYYRLNRLAWFFAYGVWPSKFIDHIDRNNQNNRLSNLRDLSNAENGQNRVAQSNNSLGIKGVVFLKDRNRYRARLTVNGHIFTSQNFEKLEEAIAWREEMVKKHHPFAPNV